MDRDTIIKRMKRLQLPKEDYWIVAGSALVLHQVKCETRDIDLGITTALYEALQLEGYRCTLANDGTRVVHLANDIEAFENWSVQQIIHIEGLPTGSLTSIIEHKIKLGRQKDIEDIKLIEDYISQGN